MNNDQQIFPPPLPTPVLSYQSSISPPPSWLPRLICGLAFMQGADTAGYVVTNRISTYNLPPYAITDLPLFACGGLLAIFASLGFFRVRGSRWAIAVASAGVMLASWAEQWLNFVQNVPFDKSMIPYTVLSIVDRSVIPVFVTICVMREPIRGYFRSRRI